MKTILPVVAMLISVIGLLYQHFGVIMKLKDDNNLALIKIREDTARELMLINSRLATLDTKTELFWRCVEGKLADFLKSYPTYLAKDVLLDKLVDKSLTLEEAESLRTALDCELRLTKDNQIVYVLMLARLSGVIYDLRKELEYGTGKIPI